MANALQFVITFVASLIVGFVKGWQLTLIILGFAPVVAVFAGVFGYKLANFATVAQEIYAGAGAGAIAHESVTAIRTVAASKQQERYEEQIKSASQVRTKQRTVHVIHYWHQLLQHVHSLWSGALVWSQVDR